jgi:glucose/arabinose dehydrogenase
MSRMVNAAVAFHRSRLATADRRSCTPMSSTPGQPCGGSDRRRRLATVALWVLVALVALVTGCAPGPRMYSAAQQRYVDRKYVEYPAGYQLTLIADRLTAPSAIAFTPDGSIILAETGLDMAQPRVYGWRADGTFFDVYPLNPHSPFRFWGDKFRMYGPIGGMCFHDGYLYVSHRDAHGLGVITRLGLDGSARTVVADLPTQGDFALTDVTVSPTGRLVFGIGTATNSGVVGLDNFTIGWPRQYPKVHDQSYVHLKLLGYRFNTSNPNAGLFGGDNVAVTAPLQAFGVSNQTRVLPSPTGKPNGAIYSISPTGGDLRVEAYGIRLPRGLRYNEFGRLYATNNGMELRGTRPVQDDPDALLRVVSGTWYGWPDYSADLRPITELPINDFTKSMIVKSGYPDLAFLIDHAASNLLAPNRETLVSYAFKPLSGAAKLDFVPEQSAFPEFRGSAIVALSGDRAPFATGGQPLKGTIGYEVTKVDIDGRTAEPFVHNTKGKPASRIPRDEAGDAMERPVDVKFAPDGSLYILDFGRMQIRNGQPDIIERTGKLYRLVPLPVTSTTLPLTEPTPR